MEYILSQVFVILTYILFGATYLVKNRKIILFMNISSLVTNGISYTLLGAWAGLAMIFVALIRNVIFLLQNKYKKTDNFMFYDYIILIFLLGISVALGVVTYDGFLSLFSLFGSLIYTISIWQKNLEIYKWLGILSSLCSVVYLIAIKSIFGFALEFALLIFMICTLIKELKDRKKIITKDI